MTKCLTIAAVVLLLAGCRDSRTQTAYKYKQPIASNGEFLVPQEDLPPKIVELARALKRLPIISSDTEFRSMLTTNGLNKEPDYYKDGVHFWYLDEAFRPDTDPQKRTYRMSVGHFLAAGSAILFYFASIERVFPNEPWREWLWKIDWPIEPVN